MNQVHLAWETPRWLWLLVPCMPLVSLIAAAWPSSHRWRWPLLGARTVLVAGLILAAARPAVITNRPSISAVALLDVSASMSDASLNRMRDLALTLRNAAAPGHELRVVSFAGAPREILLDGDRREGSPPPSRDAEGDDGAGLKRAPGRAGLQTDIARALGFAAGLPDPTRTRRLLLVSDGWSTTGDALAQATALRRAGIRLDYVLMANRGGGNDVAVRGLVAPPAIAPRATFPLRIQLVAQRSTSARLRLTRNGEPLPESKGSAPQGDGWRTTTITPGESEVTWDVSMTTADSTTVFGVEVRPLHAQDDHPENNRALLAVAPRPVPRVVVITTDAAAIAEVSSLTAALRAQSMEVQEARGTSALERALQAEALGGTDLVVLCDVARTGAVEGKLGVLERYVRDGGGLMVMGGPHAFGPGGWDGSRLADLLPVQLDAPRQRDEPDLALALVIDRSGSMSGPKMELTKQAARGTAEMLPADDQIAVVAFDSQAAVVVPLQRAANRLRISNDIGRIQPTGGTNIMAGLREAVDQLGSARAKKKHAILLSDGQSATEGIADLVDAAAAAHITISTIGVGDGVDEALLQTIARQGDGRYYHARDPASIPRLFTRETSEVSSSGIVEKPTATVIRRRAAMIAGIPWGTAPPLRGYVRTHPRRQAELVLATEDGDPLLAHWSVGLGQVTAWSSDAGSRWAEAWTRWPPFAQLWGQLARAAMRTRAARQFPLQARADGNTVEVMVEATAADDHALSGLEGTVEITAVDGAGRTVALRSLRAVILTETTPGQYQARFSLPGDQEPTLGALLLRATLRQEGKAVGEALGQVSLPQGAELTPPTDSQRPSLRGDALLEALAAVTGGGALKTPSDLFSGAEPRGRSRSLVPPLLGVLAMLFVAEIVARRLGRSR